MECHGICQSLDELIKSRSLHLNQITIWTCICKYYTAKVDVNMNPACSAHLCVNGADMRFCLLTLHTWMNEWMMHLYSAFCVLLYTQSALQSCGGGLSSTITSVQHPLGWCDGCHRTTAPVRSPHTRYRWRGERVIEPIKWKGIIRRPWLTMASGGNLARTPGLHPTLYEKCHGIFNDHRESGPRFNVSSERRCLLTV